MREREKYKAWMEGYETEPVDAWDVWQAARESQAKELAEAQARVVVALDQLKLDLMLENERMPTMTKRALDKFEQALAFTDTAVQELRQKYIEPTSCGRCDYDEAEGGLIEQCPKCKAIDAAKEKP